MTERIVVSSDHAGFALKQAIKTFLAESGNQVDDVGTHSTEPVDYPRYTLMAAEGVSTGEYPRGIVFCGTGQGDAIVANKVSGVRAALCWDTFTAEMSRSHNDANMLVLGGWLLGERLAREIVRVWLNTPFAGGRHQRRIEQISGVEVRSYFRPRKIYDVSLLIYPGMLVWPGDAPVSVDTVKSLDQGGSSNLSSLHMGSHSGTHVDAPRHFIEGAPGIDQADPAVLLGQARLFQLLEVHSIDRNVLQGLDLEGVTRVLFGTRNSALLKTGQFDTGYVSVSEDGARYLVDKGVKLVGVDYLSVEEYHMPGHPVHRTLLGGGLVVIEGLELSQVPAGDYEIICLPLKIKDCDGSPARVLLREV